MPRTIPRAIPWSRRVALLHGGRKADCARTAFVVTCRSDLKRPRLGMESHANGPFISVSNMQTVLDLLQFQLPRRDDGFATAAINRAGTREGIPPVKQVVYDIMVDIAEDAEFDGVPVGTKNDVVVDATVRYFAQLAQKANIPPIVASSGRGGRGSEFARRQESPSAADDYRTNVMDRVDDPFAPSAHGVQAVAASSEFLPTEIQSRTDDVLFDDVGKTGGKSGSQGEKNMVEVRRCMSLDGQDRDVFTWRSRYQYCTHFDETLKQVKSVAVAAVVVPLQDHTVNAPFLLLCLDEISGLYAFNRSDSVRKCFAKLIPESTYASAHGRTYVVLKPAFDDSVTYDPVLPALSRLTLQLTRPDGLLISKCEDTLNVVKITQSSDGNWILEFDRFWPVQEFGRGDIVRLQHCGTGVDAVDAYVNRLEGHEVLEIGKPLADEGCNKIMIRFAGKLDKETGNYVKDPKAEPAFDGTHTKSKAVGEIDVSCSAMNMSLQMSATLMIKCLEPSPRDKQSR